MYVCMYVCMYTFMYVYELIIFNACMYICMYVFELIILSVLYVCICDANHSVSSEGLLHDVGELRVSVRNGPV